MTIRFLQTVPSDNPSFPFQAGQVIHVEHPTLDLLDYVDGVRAEIVKSNEPEYAVVASPVFVSKAKANRRRRSRDI